MIEIYTVKENPYKLGERNTRVYAYTFPISNTHPEFMSQYACMSLPRVKRCERIYRHRDTVTATYNGNSNKQPT
jgi:hypothetical protein